MAGRYIPGTEKEIEGLKAFADEMLEPLSTPETRRATLLYREDEEKARKVFTKYADFFAILNNEKKR